MKSAIKFTFGTMLVASLAAPSVQANVLDRVAVNGTVTYSEATNNGLSVGELASYRQIFVEPRHEWDYGLGFSYRLEGSDTHLYLDFDHFKDSKDRFSSLLTNIGLASANGAAAASHFTQETRVGVMHTLHFGSKVDLTLNGFFDFAKLQRKLDETMVSGANIHYRHTEDELKGYGPGFGAMVRALPFSDCPQFGLFGGANAALLYSDQDFTQVVYQNGVVSESHFPESSKSMVTKVDAEFGVDYRNVFRSDMANFSFQAAVGMRYMNAVNAFKNGNTAWNRAATNFATYLGAPNDFGRMGPFLRITLGGVDA